MGVPVRQDTWWLKEVGSERLGAGVEGRERRCCRDLLPTHQKDGVSSSEVKKNIKER